MKNLILLIIIAAGIACGQTYKIVKITGSAKILDQYDKWIEAKEGLTVSSNSLLIADDNSTVKISGNGVSFTLKESSAVHVSSVKQMTLNEMLLALAMEDIMNAPRKKGNNNGKTTAVYGSKESAVEKIISTDDFGIKRIRGAVQLSENGFKESATVTAREVFRKYPSIKTNAEYRIYFAGLLYSFGLYEEAYDEFISIKGLNLSGGENTETEIMIERLSKKLIIN